MNRSPIARSTQGIKRTAPIGEKKRRAVQWERAAATALEGETDKHGNLTKLGLFSLHHIDWLHWESSETARGTLKAGHPDYLLIGADWLSFLEIKARNAETGRAGKMHAEQHTFHERLRRAGVDVWTALLPDDLQQINLWLREKTGVVVEVML